jgi:hypothetical protein
VPAPIAESVQLFDMAQLQPRLFFDPSAQSDFHGPVHQGVEGTPGQCIRMFDIRTGNPQDAWVFVDYGHDGSVHDDFDALLLGPIGLRSRYGIHRATPSCGCS